MGKGERTGLRNENTLDSLYSTHRTQKGQFKKKRKRKSGVLVPLIQHSGGKRIHPKAKAALVYIAEWGASTWSVYVCVRRV